jgi:MFS family permease
MTPYSLTNYYVDQKFNLPKATLGDIISVAYFFSAFSTTFSGPLTRRLGPVPAMVWSHLPGSAALAFIPLPSSKVITFGLILFRAAVSSMDQAPRAAFVAGIIRPEERTAVMGINSMLRTAAQSLGPSVTGLLAHNDKFWVAFVVAGTLRCSYDISLWLMFGGMELHRYEKVDETVGKQGAGQRIPIEDEEELKELPKK